MIDCNECGLPLSTEYDLERERLDADQAREHIRLLLPLAKGYAHANPGVKVNSQIIREAAKFIDE